MGSTRFRNPRALSSALALLGMLQPRALGFLNRVDPLVSASNLYLVFLQAYEMRLGKETKFWGDTTADMMSEEE